MADILEFGSGSSLGNDSMYAAPRNWVWSRAGRGISVAYDNKGYPRYPKVFGVGWQVNTPKHVLPGTHEFDSIVRLWVDSPRYEDNPPLNDLKCELVNALMHSELRGVMWAKGYRCDESSLRRTDEGMQKTKTTTVFKIIPRDHRWASPEEPIKMVHADLGQAVNEVLQAFTQRLETVFAK